MTFEIRYRCDVADKSVGIGILNRRSVLPVHAIVVPHFAVYNSIIGACSGEIVSASEVKDRRLFIWVDDCGAVRDNPEFNRSASILAGQPIYGDAIVMSPDSDGEAQNLSLEDMLAISEVIASKIHDACKIATRGGGP